MTLTRVHDMKKVTKDFYESMLQWPLIVLSMLLLLSGGGAAWYVNHLYSDLAAILDLNVASVRAAEELVIVLRELKTEMDETPLNLEENQVRTFHEQVKNADYWLAEVERLATTPDEQKIIEILKKGYQNFFEVMSQFQGQLNQDQVADLKFVLQSILSKEVIPPAHAYLDFNEHTMLLVANEHKIFSRHIATGLVVIAICGSIGGFGAGIIVARRLARSLVALSIPISIAAGKLSEIVGPIRVSTQLDLGELKNILVVIAEEVEKVVLRLQKAQHDMLSSEKLVAIGKLAAGAAHEIRNPVMSIKLLIQAARLQGDPTSLKNSDLKLIEQELSRVEATIQGLLTFARQAPVTWDIVSPHVLIDQCCSLIRGRANIQGVMLESLIQTNLKSFLGDAQQLSQAIMNLLLNAMDATSRGDIVKISLIEERDPSVAGCDRLKLTVEDTGLGISEDILSSIFEPFVSYKRSGTGLGLSISKRIIEAHQGEVFAHNRDDRGACVGFYIPLTPSKLREM